MHKCSRQSESRKLYAVSSLNNSNMINYPSLFSPGKIGSLEAKNRIVMAPMVRNYADEKGFVTPRYVAHIDRIARGGVGTMILEASFIRQDGKGFTHQLGLHVDDVIPGLAKLVEVAHASGAALGPQLFHAGRQTSSQITGVQPVAPSTVPDPTVTELPRSLDVEEIHEIVDAFAQAAKRAKEAGCDLVEIHGAHGYLITQFLSPFSNYRDDIYGGSEEGRMRFASEIIQAVRKAVGPDFPVTMRISANEMVPNGLTLEDSVVIAKKLEELGVDAVHVSSGNNASFNRGFMIPPMALPDAPEVPFAEWIKQWVRIPVIAVGKIRSPDLAEEILRTGKADFVALGRPLLADPDWPKKAQEGRSTEINKCVACNEGCITRLFANKDVWCTVHPETAREEEFAKPLPSKSKRVFIAGGGPAGMKAAQVAALRGHEVVLLEELDHLGGALVPAAVPPHRQGWEELCSYLAREMDRRGIDVRLKTKATAELAKKEGANVAIVAVGASPVRSLVPGSQHENVVTGRDLLEGKATAKGKVVVLGGGISGALVAEYLAGKGHGVTIVGTTDAIAKEAAVVDRDLLLERLQELGVEMLTEAKILLIQNGKVLVTDSGGMEDLPMELPADTVVICQGSKSNDGIATELRAVVDQVFVVGDAALPRDVTYAMLEGARAGLL